MEPAYSTGIQQKLRDLGSIMLEPEQQHESNIEVIHTRQHGEL